MQVVFSKRAAEDILYWQKTGNKPILNKIRLLIQSIKETPFSGSGKPEALKHNLSGYWSRRITREHRMVYKIEDDTIKIAYCRYHY